MVLAPSLLLMEQARSNMVEESFADNQKLLVFGNTKRVFGPPP